ncbi:hypothetical protein [Hymenobacter bucti]|uniref:Uncharacterized protein n=1 Tax=Hymenobacter bucti TaxID=1844114 RepID=A0ABW4R1P6_9BACT
MLDSFIDRYSEATITRVQTTYLEVAVSTGVFRIQYRDKVEFVAKPSAQGRLAQMRDHPLLWDYNGPCDTVYLSNAALDPPHLLAELQRMVATVTQGWRSLERYLFLRPKASAVTLLTQNLANGSGLLLQSAPIAIVEVVRTACQQHGVTTYCRP